MKKTTIVVKEDGRGVWSFWTGGYNFTKSVEAAAIVTPYNAREIAKSCADKFPGEIFRLVRQYEESSSSSPR